jgi:protoporphyrinogen oxidase
MRGAQANSKSVVVLGGGLAGASTAYALARSGYRDVTVVERLPEIGGLAGSFERDGHLYPLGYHHILHRDRTLLFFLDRIGALPSVRWRRVRMLFSLGGRAYDLSRPGDFLAFPLSLLDKASFAKLMLSAFLTDDWSSWIGRNAHELLAARTTTRVREVIFEPLTRLKFQLPCSEVSAAWLGARLSFREGSAPLGYIPRTNWTTVLCKGVARLLADQGVKVRVSTGVERLVTDGDRIVSAELQGGERLDGDVFVSALPTTTYMRLAPDDRTPGLGQIRYTGLLSTLCATRQKIDADFYWMNLSSLDRTACALFNLTSLNPTIGGPGETCFNFVTHLQAPTGVFELSDDELAARYRDDFRALMGVPLDPLWTVINRVRAYSPIFTPDYRNVPVQSTTFANVFFTGNYRTFPSITSTGTALGAGLDTARAISADCEPLRDEAHGFHLRSMPRG